jgi:hypothetical protein
MPSHSDRRMTLRWTKLGPPAGSRQDSLWRRHVACIGNQPVLHAIPSQRMS